MIKNKALFLVLGFIGVILLVTATIVSINKVKFLQEAEVTQEEIINYTLERSNGAGAGKPSTTVFYPNVRFVSPDNQTIEFRSGVASNRKPYTLGFSVSVVYNPQNLKGAEINSLMRLWFLPFTLSFMALIFIIISIVSFNQHSG